MLHRRIPLAVLKQKHYVFQLPAVLLHRRIPLAVLKLHELALTEVNLGCTAYIFHTKNTTRKIEWYFCVEMQCEHPYRENLLKTLC